MGLHVLLVEGELVITIRRWFWTPPANVIISFVNGPNEKMASLTSH